LRDCRTIAKRWPGIKQTEYGCKDGTAAISEAVKALG